MSVIGPHTGYWAVTTWGQAYFAVCRLGWPWLVSACRHNVGCRPTRGGVWGGVANSDLYSYYRQETVTVYICFTDSQTQCTCQLWAMSNIKSRIDVWSTDCYLMQSSTGWKYYEVSTHTFYHFDEQAFLSVWKVWTEAVEGQLPRIIKTQIPYKELENFPITSSPVFLDTLLSLYCPRLKCSCSLFATLCVSESIGMNRIFRKIHTKKLWQDYIF